MKDWMFETFFSLSKESNKKKKKYKSSLSRQHVFQKDIFIIL